MHGCIRASVLDIAAVHVYKTPGEAAAYNDALPETMGASGPITRKQNKRVKMAAP